MEILSTILTILFIIDCILLILIVLLQANRSAGMGVFGGSSQTVFGAGSADVLTKITAVLAAAFMLIALSLAFIKSRQYARPKLEQKSPTTEITPAPETKPEEPKNP